MDGLKHCSTMLSELRNSSLTPKNYYELCKGHILDLLRDRLQSLADGFTKVPTLTIRLWVL